MPISGPKGHLNPEDMLEILDGRQSEAAAAIQRGTCRLLHALGHSVVTELPLASGHRADIMALGRNGEIWIVEIKSCLADFRSDAKWHFYREWCDRLFFAVDPEFPQDILPDDAGFLLADRYGAEVIREAPEHKLAGGRRKAVTLRFARAAAARLHGFLDPGPGNLPED